MSTVAVLHDNPPLSGKKFFLASMISPESRNKHDVYAFKFHDVCETEDEGKRLCQYYHKMDPDFDVFLGTIGKWSPWVFDPLSITDVEYANSQLTELVGAHRANATSSDSKWHEDVNNHIKDIQRGATREGQLELANRRESPESVYHKIQQLNLVIKRRKDELEAIEDIFHTNYTKEERKHAKNVSLALTEPTPMKYEEYTEPKVETSIATTEHDRLLDLVDYEASLSASTNKEAEAAP